MPLQFQENIWTTAPSFPVAFQPLNEFWLFEFWLTHSLITYCTCIYCAKMKEIKWKIILDCVKTRFLKFWKLIAPWLRDIMCKNGFQLSLLHKTKSDFVFQCLHLKIKTRELEILL